MAGTFRSEGRGQYGYRNFVLNLFTEAGFEIDEVGRNYYVSGHGTRFLLCYNRILIPRGVKRLCKEAGVAIVHYGSDKTVGDDIHVETSWELIGAVVFRCRFGEWPPDPKLIAEHWGDELELGTPIRL